MFIFSIPMGKLRIINQYFILINKNIYIYIFLELIRVCYIVIFSKMYNFINQGVVVNIN